MKGYVVFYQASLGSNHWAKLTPNWNKYAIAEACNKSHRKQQWYIATAMLNGGYVTAHSKHAVKLFVRLAWSCYLDVRRAESASVSLRVAAAPATLPPCLAGMVPCTASN